MQVCPLKCTKMHQRRWVMAAGKWLTHQSIWGNNFSRTFCSWPGKVNFWSSENDCSREVSLSLFRFVFGTFLLLLLPFFFLLLLLRFCFVSSNAICSVVFLDHASCVVSLDWKWEQKQHWQDCRRCCLGCCLVLNRGKYVSARTAVSTLSTARRTASTRAENWLAVSWNKLCLRMGGRCSRPNSNSCRSQIDKPLEKNPPQSKHYMPRSRTLRGIANPTFHPSYADGILNESLATYILSGIEEIRWGYRGSVKLSSFYIYQIPYGIRSIQNGQREGFGGF